MTLNIAPLQARPLALPIVDRVRRIASRAKRAVGIAYNRTEALLFDLRHGTDTRGKTAAANMGLTGEGALHATGYQAVNEAHLSSVLRAHDFPAGSTFVDIGSGKGKALLLASRHKPISRVVGIEISAPLSAIAERNVAAFERAHGRAAEISVVAADAIEAPIEPDQNIIFLNNPFDEAFLKLFLDKLDKSLSEHPRRLWLLYANPQARRLLTDAFHYSLIKEHAFFGPGRNIAVYSKGA